MVWVRIARASCLSGFSLDESGWLFEVPIEKSTNIYFAHVSPKFSLMRQISVI